MLYCQFEILMMTSSNGNIFRVTGHLCGEFTGPGEFPTQRPVTRGFDVFFDLRLNIRLSKQPWGWWFETLSPPLWRHRNAFSWLLSVISQRWIWPLFLLTNRLICLVNAGCQRPRPDPWHNTHVITETKYTGWIGKLVIYTLMFILARSGYLLVLEKALEQDTLTLHGSRKCRPIT